MPAAKQRSDDGPVLVRIDPATPSIARVYDALVGGHDHYESDRVVLRKILEVAPEAQLMAKELRHWLIRTVRFLADRMRIDQFLDLGSGFPTAENTHQIAQRYRPEAHVVYVDNDPVVQAHGRAVLEENEYTHVSGADITRPAEALADPEITKYLDFSRPIGVIMCGIVHHIKDLDEAREVVQAYVDAVPSGSYLVLAHQHNPGDGSEAARIASSLDDRFHGTGLDTLYRSREDIESLFSGLELVEPGLTNPHLWWPDGPRLHPLSPVNLTTLGGVARKP